MRELGNTGVQVSVLAFGAMHIADPAQDEAAAGRLLNEVLDLGINVIDTARSYGESEARIGRHIAHRRSEFLLSTKVGYGVDGVPDWTYDCIVGGVERALKLMRTEMLDIVHFHSCPIETLQRGEVIEALLQCQREGKLRFAAYSGENEALQFAMECGAFQVLQTSISICDQANLSSRLPQAAALGQGVLAKRPLASNVWRHSERPGDFAEGHYWDRWQAMQIDPQGLEWNELALRFAAFQPGVSAALVGTSKASNLRRNLGALAKGPLPQALQDALRGAFRQEWPGII
ncbi:MAG TPA: aldo/keto reductase [Burkholderiaceae bacterium]